MRPSLLAIPQSSRLPRDKVIWNETKYGVVSVKKSYRVALNLVRNTEEAGMSSGNCGRTFWKVVWGVNVPKKVKQFLWRACTDCLPTKNNFLKESNPEDVLCTMCEGSRETPLNVSSNVRMHERSGWLSETTQSELGTLRDYAKRWGKLVKGSIYNCGV